MKKKYKIVCNLCSQNIYGFCLCLRKETHTHTPMESSYLLKGELEWMGIRWERVFFGVGCGCTVKHAGFSSLTRDCTVLTTGPQGNS